MTKAYRAVEALGVIVVVKSLDPPVSSFDWESAGDALRCEQLVPICKRKLYKLYKLYKKMVVFATRFYMGEPQAVHMVAMNALVLLL